MRKEQLVDDLVDSEVQRAIDRVTNGQARFRVIIPSFGLPACRNQRVEYFVPGRGRSYPWQRYLTQSLPSLAAIPTGEDMAQF